MSAQKTTDTHDETISHPNLAAALAAFQLHLPHIGKDNTAQVRSDKGNYTYRYADLSDVSAAVLPALARHGLSFSSKPTLTDDGRFVLAYVLRHEGGQVDEGTWPLPTSGTPQQIGSAVTYFRRYALCAVTGVSPDEDDDGQAAQREQTYDRPPARQAPAREERVQQTPVDRARADLVRLVEDKGWDIVAVRKRFAGQYGYPLREASEAGVVSAFTKLLPGESDADLVPVPLDAVPASASNGATQ